MSELQSVQRIGFGFLLTFAPPSTKLSQEEEKKRRRKKKIKKLPDPDPECPDISLYIQK